MQFTNFLAVAVLLAGSALAAPAPDAFANNKPVKPQQPPPPTTVNQQQNSCGNSATPYCCNTDNKGKYTTCKVIGDASSQCSQTTVCCNANNSIQICLGNAIIEL